MLRKTFRTYGLLVALLLFAAFPLAAQNVDASCRCSYLAFEDRWHLAIGTFTSAETLAEEHWGKQFGNLLHHALLETNCYVVYGKAPSCWVEDQSFILEGALLHFQRAGPHQRAKVQWMLRLRRKNSQSTFWQETFELEGDIRSALPLVSTTLLGVDLSTFNLSESDLALLRSGIHQSLQHIHSELQQLKADSAATFDRQAIQLMVLPDFTNLEAILQAQQQPAFKAGIRLVSKALETRGFWIKDTEGMQQVSLEKQVTRQQLLTKPFEILQESAPPDIIVYVDVKIDSIGTSQQAMIALSAQDRYTAKRYATAPLLQSTKRQWPDLYRPVSEALNDAGFQTFLNELDQQMRALLQHGRTIDWQIEAMESANWTLDKKVNAEQSLADVIIDWIRAKSRNQRFHQSSLSSTLLRIESQVAVQGQQADGNSPLDLGRALQNYLQDLLHQSGDPSELTELKTNCGSIQHTIH